jgi:hypothetical protein
VLNAIFEGHTERSWDNGSETSLELVEGLPRIVVIYTDRWAGVCHSVDARGCRIDVHAKELLSMGYAMLFSGISYDFSSSQSSRTPNCHHSRRAIIPTSR